MGKCWLWLGRPNVHGYGRLGVDYNRIDAHVFSYELNVSPVPKGMCVLHKCDNRMCVNPDHLFVGTRTDNMVDKVEKDRQHKGEQFKSAKLSDDKVREIRKRHKVWSATRTNTKELAMEFGVSTTVILRVVSGRGWKHVT